MPAIAGERRFAQRRHRGLHSANIERYRQAITNLSGSADHTERAVATAATERPPDEACDLDARAGRYSAGRISMPLAWRNSVSSPV